MSAEGQRMSGRHGCLRHEPPTDPGAPALLTNMLGNETPTGDRNQTSVGSLNVTLIESVQWFACEVGAVLPRCLPNQRRQERLKALCSV